MNPTPDARKRKARIEAGMSELRPGEPRFEQICREALSLLGVTTAALILMSDQEAGALVTASDEGAAQVEDLQFALGEGPCLEAFRTGRVVLADNLDDGPREQWPRFVAAASAAGVRSVFAVPLQLGAIRMGVLYLTRTRTGGLTDGQLADAFSLAEMATVALLEQQSGSVNGELDADLGLRWAHRPVVHQATGMVSAHLELPLTEALTWLRDTALETRRTIYEVATDVVARRLRIEA